MADSITSEACLETGVMFINILLFKNKLKILKNINIPI